MKIVLQLTSQSDRMPIIGEGIVLLEVVLYPLIYFYTLKKLPNRLLPAVVKIDSG